VAVFFGILGTSAVSECLYSAHLVQEQFKRPLHDFVTYLAKQLLALEIAELRVLVLY
jgi:hypothetical protein